MIIEQQLEVATHNDVGDVHIEFNSQEQSLLSPDGTLKLLPCDNGDCDKVLWVSLRAVSVLCVACADRNQMI